MGGCNNGHEFDFIFFFFKALGFFNVLSFNRNEKNLNKNKGNLEDIFSIWQLQI